jgi:hypothetical protein
MSKTIYSEFLIALVSLYKEEDLGGVRQRKNEVQKWITKAAKRSGQYKRRSFNRDNILEQLVSVGEALEKNFVIISEIKNGRKAGVVVRIKNPDQLINNLIGQDDSAISSLVKDYNEHRTVSQKTDLSPKMENVDKRIEQTKQALLDNEKKEEEGEHASEVKAETEQVKSAVTVVRKRKTKQEVSCGVTRRTYAPKILLEGYYISILAKAYGYDIEKIVRILTNNLLLEFTESFKTSQELKARIYSGKLSTVFSVTSDNHIGYKAQGQGIVSFSDLKTKFYSLNYIQEASIMVYDPHGVWRENVNSNYVDPTSIRMFTSAPEVCGCTAHWGCTPSALYNAFKEFHLPIQGKFHYLNKVEIPLPFIKEEIFPNLMDHAMLFMNNELTPDMEKLRNTALLYWADLNA